MKINVLKYGLKGDGSLESKALQAIIDNYANKDNLIYFPEGTYVLSTIYLKEHTHIHFAKGAIILGSKNFYDFDRDEKLDYPLYQDQSHSYFHSSLFVGEHVNNISFSGKGFIDMQSVWDEDNIRGIVHRGCKCIALKECDDVMIEGLKIENVTDLAVYFAGCHRVTVRNLNLKVYIDGISPDNSKDVLIENCRVLAGDDAIVFKSSYTLNRLDTCENIVVRNCHLSSRCNAIKFGTETNGGFYHIDIQNIKIVNTRITGISIESVDGAIIDDIKISNVLMQNVNAPLFIHIGRRLRGPEGLQIGQIKNVTISNVLAKGPYKPYETIAWNYISYKNNDIVQYPWAYDYVDSEEKLAELKEKPWQFTSNICGLEDRYLENITLNNIEFILDGGVKEYNHEVPHIANPYPEVYVYGRILPASGLYFRYVKGLTLNNVSIKTIKPDSREKIIIE